MPQIQKIIHILYTIVAIGVVLSVVAYFCAPLEKDLYFDVNSGESRKLNNISLGRNYASASAGAYVIGHSKTWTGGHPYLYLFFFIPVGSVAPSPVIALKKTHEPGECWPLEGSKGYVQVYLASPVYIDGFTIEHIPQNEHLTGLMTEAPKEFSVFGYQKETGVQTLLGSYMYDTKGSPAQVFISQRRDLSFRDVILTIDSNWGNPKFTCLYRFQVHGSTDSAKCFKCS